MDDNDWEPLGEVDLKLIQARRERSDKCSKLMGDYLLKGYKMLATTCPKCDTILLQTRQGIDYCVACSEMDSDVGKDDPVLSQSAAMSKARELEFASAAAAPQINTALKPVGPAGKFSLSPEAASALSVNSQTPRQETNGVRSKSKTTQPDQGRQSSFEANVALGMTSIDVQSWPSNGGDLSNRSAPQTARSALGIKCELGGDGDSGLGPLLSNSDDTSDLPTPRSNSSQYIQSLVAKVQWASQELNKTASVEYSIQLCQLIKTASEAVVAVRTARI